MDINKEKLIQHALIHNWTLRAHKSYKVFKGLNAEDEYIVHDKDASEVLHLKIEGSTDFKILETGYDTRIGFSAGGYITILNDPDLEVEE